MSDANTPGPQDQLSASDQDLHPQSAAAVALSEGIAADEPAEAGPAGFPDFVVPPTLVVFSGIVIRLIICLIGAGVLIYLLFLVAPVSLALFMALFTTALAGPIARLIARFLPKFVPKAIPVVLALAIIATAAIIILFQIIKSIASQGEQMVQQVNKGIDDIEHWMQTGPLHMTDADLQNVINQAQDSLTGVGKSILEGVAGDLGSLGTLMTAGSVYIFATLFFMINGHGIWAWLVGWVPRRVRTQFDICGELAWETMAGYTRGVVVVAVCDAVLVFIGLVILQVPMAAGLAAVVFMGAFIPVIGAPIATLVAAVVALAANGPTTAILVVVLTVIVGSFDGDVMQPLVMGKAVSLHPLAIVTIIAVGAMTMGIIGALIAIPVASSIYAVLKYLTGRGMTEKQQKDLEAEMLAASSS